MALPAPAPLAEGLAIIHANQLESLRALLVAWLQAHPLAPLENEAILVQSNGMAQWLKLALAEADGLGVCAAVAVQLPGRFIWNAYQAVLPEAAVPDESPFDKAALAWRLYRLLPELLHDPHFTPLRQFLADDADARKRQQLAGCLADLFDQYQVYRADWLGDWAAGRPQLRDAHGQAQPLPEEQRWQALLWQALLADVAAEQRQASRALLHERFIAALEQAAQRPAGLPRRIIVFGISSLPQQILRALAALSRFCQVLLCVHNPCRYYWADIIEHKELLRAERRRQRHKPQMPAQLKDEDLHLHAHPLLAAWGKQGRDYIRLLDEFDDPEHYREWFQRIDLFDDYGEDGRRSLLQQVQQAILDLAPPPAAPEQRIPIGADDSLAFHIAHSPQREVEILHDQLLAFFSDGQRNGRPLSPRDVIVMVPDIDAYAPHIRAVFGQIPSSDPRYLPFSLADQKERGRNPLLIALEALLQLPQARFSVSELLDLLEAPALRLRFGIDEADVPTLHRWIEQAGIRWGLHAQQRQSLGLMPGLEQNSWRFGLRRMLLGYAVGQGQAWDGIEPYEEIGGLEAALVGPLALLLDNLESYWQALGQDAGPAQWGERLRGLLAAFFLPAGEGDSLTLERLDDSLEQWENRCRLAGLEEALPLSVVREAWLAAMDEPNLAQRFLAGRVNFCTLMPMRAIPFKIVCLLGMNDGDYPRSQTPLSFDLMRQPRAYRPGDRSRREDDRYLFLEALLSARDKFYLSWSGRSARDNSERPASLLASQLRDYLADGWQDSLAPKTDEDGGQRLLQRLTVEHPLQAFSPRYFLPPGSPGHDPRLFSYAHEWRAAHDGHEPGEAAAALPPFTAETPLSLDSLAGFLRSPAQAFFNQRLKVWFSGNTSLSEDLEPFAFDPLQKFTLGADLLQAALAAPAEAAEQAFAEQQARQQRQGLLPLAGFADAAQADFANPAWSAYHIAERLLQDWPVCQDTPLEIALSFDIAGQSLRLEDWLSGLRRNDQGQWGQILASPQAVKAEKGRPKWRQLLRPWVRHLAACAQGLALHTRHIGADGVVTLPPLAQAEALAYLHELLAAWLHGMAQPLPLACRSAFAQLEGQDARSVYEGDERNPGEVQRDAYLARAYPRFDDLLAAPDERDFGYWLERVYAPLWRSVADSRE
jgi:exodeoxyribonuclease V gamma subunit